LSARLRGKVSGAWEYSAPISRENSEDTTVAAEAYCVKCKTKREIKDAVQITMKNGRPATEGKCPECGTKMFKIGASS
jgi:RNase P subunit RPR2